MPLRLLMCQRGAVDREGPADSTENSMLHTPVNCLTQFNLSAIVR